MKKYGILSNESGQGLTEYITLLLLIAVVSLGVTKTLGTEIKKKIEKARTEIDQNLDVR